MEGKGRESEARGGLECCPGEGAMRVWMEAWKVRTESDNVGRGL